LIFERGALLHHLLGARRVIPQIGIFDRPVQFGETDIGLVEVKDASSAVPGTA